MKTANPASLGVLAFGLACFVVGALFIGWFGALNAGNMFVGAMVGLSTALILLIVTYLMLRTNSVADSPVFSMWVGTVFGFFAQVWIVMGLVLLGWKDGVNSPLSFVQLYLCLICIGYLVHSVALKLWSFVFLFLGAAIATIAGFTGLFLNWPSGTVIAGYGFFFLALLALYIVFKEQLTIILPKKTVLHENKPQTQTSV